MQSSGKKLDLASFPKLDNVVKNFKWYASLKAV